MAAVDDDASRSAARRGSRHHEPRRRVARDTARVEARCAPALDELLCDPGDAAELHRPVPSGGNDDGAARGKLARRPADVRERVLRVGAADHEQHGRVGADASLRPRRLRDLRHRRARGSRRERRRGRFARRGTSRGSPRRSAPDPSGPSARCRRSTRTSPGAWRSRRSPARPSPARAASSRPSAPRARSRESGPRPRACASAPGASRPRSRRRSPSRRRGRASRRRAAIISNASRRTRGNALAQRGEAAHRARTARSARSPFRPHSSKIGTSSSVAPSRIAVAHQLRMLRDEVLRGGGAVGDPVDVDLVVPQRGEHVGEVVHRGHRRVLPRVGPEPRDARLDVGADRGRRRDGSAWERALEPVRAARSALVDEHDVATSRSPRRRSRASPPRPRSPSRRGRP